MSNERTVRAAVTTYLAPDGAFRIALRGDVIRVRDDSLKRFDELDGQDPQPEEKPTRKAR